MPLVQTTYDPPAIFRNYHVSTVYSAVFRKAPVEQQRERLELTDGDFIDLDWSYSKKGKSDKVLLVIHGLEGSAQRPYVTGLARYFTENAWDVAAINLRGCSGELNRKFRSYHAGATDDLEEAVQHVLAKRRYSKMAFNGFSLGANLMLKYLGGRRPVPPEIKAAVMVSVPCDLQGSLQMLQERNNYLYSQRFLRKLKSHLSARAKKFPQEMKKEEISRINDLLAFDNCYTSRAHGFKDAQDYYKKNSSLQFLPNLDVPTLIINAKNDGFLSEACYPIKTAEENKKLFLEMPEYGGHVGFLQKKRTTYTEERALDFISSRI
ncbi:MAG: alpha/beta fold hydrolase [Salinimicrobium sp.]